MKQNLAERFEALGGIVHPDHRGTTAVAFHSTTEALHAFARVGSAIHLALARAGSIGDMRLVQECEQEWKDLLETRVDMIDGELVLVV